MQFDLSPEDAAFRLEVRAFQGLLHKRCWGAPHWPKEWGGTDWSPLRQHFFMQALDDADDLDSSWQGLHMVAPVLLAFGSQAQKDRHLPPMINGDEFWAQGFSEPHAGSDPANLRTKAELVGDEWVVNGQNIWTSDANLAAWGFFLVRTDATVKPQRGIAFLLIRLDTPGLTIRPIVSIEGGTGLHEVFLDNVRVPRENLVGETGMGRTSAKYLLEKARDIEKAQTINGLALMDTPSLAQKFARVEVDVMALEYSVLRALTLKKNRQSLDAVVSALKLRGSALQQRVTELQVEVLGLHALRQWHHGEGEDLSAEDSLVWPDMDSPSASFRRCNTAWPKRSWKCRSARISFDSVSRHCTSHCSAKRTQAGGISRQGVMGSAGRFVGAQGIQLHGGIGLTDEHQISHLYKRLLVLEKMHGDSE